jgi:membrane protease YdiL (CAAX protease family)
MRRYRFLLAAFVFEGLLSLAAVLIGWLVGISPWYSTQAESLGFVALSRDLLWGLAATAPLVAVLLLEDYPLWRALTDLKDQVSGLLHRLLCGATYTELFILALLAGLGEELLFRGLLQTGLSYLLPAPIAVVGSLVLASVIFGACHYLSHTYFVLATLAGFYFGLVMLISGSILPPIIAHALYDFFALVYLLHDHEAHHRRHHHHHHDFDEPEAEEEPEPNGETEAAAMPEQQLESNE